MADFPTSLVPSSRAFNPGDWPVKKFTADNGAEVRILRGSNRVGSSLELAYENIADTDAEKFLQHYRTVQGTFQSWRFPVSPSDVGVFKGWGASDTSELEASPWGMAWRYDGPPQISQTGKGRSSVQISLRGVTL